MCMHYVCMYVCMHVYVCAVSCILFFASLLASGSDDLSAIIWDPFLRKTVVQMPTGHTGNIFSVKVSVHYVICIRTYVHTCMYFM